MKKDSQNLLTPLGYFLICFGFFILMYATYVIIQILLGNFDLPYSSYFQKTLQSADGLYRISGDFNGERDDFHIEVSAGLAIVLLAVSFAVVVSTIGAIAGTAISSGIKIIYPPQYWEKTARSGYLNSSDLKQK